MNLHGAEWIAGELIALAVGAIAILWAYRQYVPPPPEPPADDPERTETTEFSSLNDD